MNYKKLLKKAKSESEEGTDSRRFKIPKLDIIKEGNKTIIKNFSKISQGLRRDKKDLSKFLKKELAAPGEIDAQRLILNRKLNKSQIKQKLQEYCNKYILCPACGKPDTKLVKEERVLKIECQACGIKQKLET